MFKDFKEIDLDLILIDPDLFNKSYVLNFGIPFFEDSENLFLISKNSSNYKNSSKNIRSFLSSDEDIEEKLYFIKNYDRWCLDLFFEDEAPLRCILDFIIISALIKKASDIHINPTESGYEVFFRIDSLLSKFCFLSKFQGQSCIIRLKVISFLDTSNIKESQSSSFRRYFKGDIFDFRISTHPTYLKERCVLRVLKNKSIPNVFSLGFDDESKNIINKVIKTPSGMVVFAGPTNSGKTTSIHSILKELTNKGYNIMTLEDPVEYKIPGVVQTNISESGMDFFSGMKSILRQDPNIIFLGEIRDEKTAKIAIQAAMTGHKVFTTIHTSSNKSIINRFLDLGVSFKSLSESLIACFSQRLIRKIDPSCDEKKYKGLTLVCDSFFFDEKAKECLRKGDFPDIKNNLKNNAMFLIKSGITDEEEVMRVIG